MKNFIKGLFALFFSMLLLACDAIGGYKPVMFALDVELWRTYVVRNLFDSLGFLNYARSADEDVLNGKVVHIPQGGAASQVKRNRTTLPAPIRQRKDTDITYTLDEYTSSPRLITHSESILSYDKFTDTMSQDMAWLKESVAIDMFWRWAKNAKSGIVRTNGDSRVAGLKAFGASGNRKAATLANVIQASEVMSQNHLEGNNYMALDFKMYHDLLAEMSANQQRDFMSGQDIQKGILGELYGFKFLKRNYVTFNDDSTTPVIIDPASVVKEDEIKPNGWTYQLAAASNSGAFFWNSDWVERAIGSIELFDEQGKAAYYGDIFSMLVNAGGRAISEQGVGVGMLIEDAV